MSKKKAVEAPTEDDRGDNSGAASSAVSAGSSVAEKAPRADFSGVWKRVRTVNYEALMGVSAIMHSSGSLRGLVTCISFLMPFNCF